MKFLLLAATISLFSIVQPQEARAGFQMYNCEVAEGVSVETWLIVGSNFRNEPTFVLPVFRDKAEAERALTGWLTGGNCVSK